MSLTQLKKRAKNAQKLLPTLIATGKPLTLSACQELVAALDGYPSWFSAAKHAGGENPGSTDLMGQFKHYAWASTPLKSDYAIYCSPVELPLVGARLSKESSSLIVMNLAGAQGADALDNWFEAQGLGPGFKFNMKSCITLGPRATYTNPLTTLGAEDTINWLVALIEHAASPAHAKASRAILRMLCSKRLPDLADIREL